MTISLDHQATLARFLAANATLIYLSLYAARAEDNILSKNHAFKLSTGTVALLRNVEVQRITSDETIDVAIVLDRKGREADGTKVMTELAEFCLRYGKAIVTAAIPADELSKLNLVVPLYKVPPDKQLGFAFRIRNYECSLEPPFPKELVPHAIEQAKKNLD